MHTIAYFGCLFLGLISSGGLTVAVNCPGFETTSSYQNAPPLFKDIIFVSRKNEYNYNATIHIAEETHKRDPNVIYISRFANKAQLNCWAPYPIDLTFSGLGTNLNAQVKTSVSSFRAGDKSKVYCYNINVTLDMIDDSIVGNYSCFEVENPKNRVHKYIYLISKPTTALLRHQTNITKSVWPGQKHISFECAVSDPNVAVNLFKVDKNSGEEKEITNDARYNPQTGFTLNFTDKNLPSVKDRYICRTKLDSSDFVNFDVYLAPKATYHPPKSTLPRKVYSSLRLSCTSDETVFFHVIDRDLWKFQPIVQNVTGKEYFEATLWFQNLTDPGSYRVACRFMNGTDIHVWTINVKEGKSTTKGRLDLNEFKDTCKDKDKFILFECNNWIECRINQCQDDPSKDRFCQPNNRCDKLSCMPNGLVQCPSYFTKGKEATINSIIYFHGISTKTEYSDASSIIVDDDTTNDILKLNVRKYVLPSSKQESGLQLTCLGTNFAVSAGFEWFVIIKHKGGSLESSVHELISPGGMSAGTGLDFTYHIQESYGRTKSTLKSNLFIPKKVLSNSPLLYFQCKAPLWNSTTWLQRNISSEDILGQWESLEEEKLNYDPLDKNILTRILSTNEIEVVKNIQKAKANGKEPEMVLITGLIIIGIWAKTNLN